MIKEKIMFMFEKNSGKIIGSLIGLILAILILIIGLLKTVFILTLVTLGYFIGTKVDRGEDLIEFAKKILNIKRN